MGTKAHGRARGRAFSEDEEAVQDVEVQLEGSAKGSPAPVELTLDDTGPTAEGGVFPRTPAALPPVFAGLTAEGGVFPRTPAALPPVFAGLVEFAVTGTKVSGEFRCSDCGYGAVVQRVLPPCPMCGGTVWETRPPRFAD
jgi:hypothetical protein